MRGKEVKAKWVEKESEVCRKNMFRKMNNGAYFLSAYLVDNERASDNNSTKWTRTASPQLHFTGMHTCMYVASCPVVDTPQRRKYIW